MLEYAKEVLTKVSFDRLLFEKELTKAITALEPQENEKLKQWCYESFSYSFMGIFSRAFSTNSDQVSINN